MKNKDREIEGLFFTGEGKIKGDKLVVREYSASERTEKIGDIKDFITKAKQNTLSREDTAELLKNLQEAGREKDILRYFVNTIRRPYLCRTAGDREGLSLDDYTRYYYTAVAVREINSITHYFAHAIAQTNESSLLLLLRLREYDTAVAFAINAEKVRLTLGDKYQDIIPSLDDVAKNIGEGRYISYKKRTGIYRVDSITFLIDVMKIAEGANKIVKAVKTSTSAIEDTIAALDIEAFIMADVKGFISTLKEAIEENRRLLRNTLTHLLRNQKKKEVRDTYTTPLEANTIRRTLEDLLTLDTAEATKAEYLGNLLLYGNNSFFVINKVEEYKKGKK